jgi:uncharacterized protein (DUF302 family)
MMKTFLALIASLLLTSSLLAGELGSVLVGSSKSFNAHDELLKVLPKAGFSVSDDRDMNGPYLKQFGSTTYDVYHTVTVYDMATVHKVIDKAPSIGAFVPYTIIIYKPKGSDETRIGFIKATTIASTLGIKDKNAINELSKSEKNLTQAIVGMEKTLKSVKLDYTSKVINDPEQFFHVSYALTPKDKALEKKEEIQSQLESDLEVAGFKIANITKLTDEMDQKKLDTKGYEFYETYSVCKLGAIYSASKKHPETGAFAPCSIFFYKKKGENVIHIGMPTTKNWVNVTNNTDPDVVKTLKDAEGVVTNSLKSITE